MTRTTTQNRITSHPPVVRASKLIGEAVINREEQSVGKIVDVVIATGTGAVDYAVLSFGGVLGMGDRLYAIPWPSLEFSPTELKLILDVDKDKLKGAPGFDKNDWPDFEEGPFAETLRAYYGTTTPLRRA